MADNIYIYKGLKNKTGIIFFTSLIWIGQKINFIFAAAKKGMAR
jgi:hypothetical protein